MKKTKILSAKNLCLISLFVALITVCSWINIPFAIPLTLQVFGVFLACAYLGLLRGALCVIVYILLGAVGVPVFSGFRGGLSHLFSHTGGFIVGFLLSAFVIGFLLKKRKNTVKFTFFAMLLALVACYIVGIVWMLYISSENINAKYISSTLLALAPMFATDIIKAFLAAVLALRLKKIGETAI